MSTTAVQSIWKILSSLRLLERRRLEQLKRRLDHFRTPPELVRDLVHRGWLTPYQGNQIVLGNTPGLELGSYLLLERLGEGGMGQVFKARHATLDRIVALKLVHRDLVAKSDMLRRFRREIRAVSQLSHPNVIRAFDADRVGNVHFLVMEFVEGIDLSRLVKKRGPMPVRDGCEAVRQAALGLQHAHDHGLVHRDIKPSNLLRAHQGGVIKLLDLGLALLQESHDDGSGSRDTTRHGTHATPLTETGRLLGTPDFIAPEQALNPRRVDFRADLYSLGCTFYFLLTGQVPFPGGTMMDKLVQHQSEEPVPVEQVRPEVPAAVGALVRKLMAKRPEDRFQTPGQLAAALAALQRSGADNKSGRAVRPTAVVGPPVSPHCQGGPAAPPLPPAALVPGPPAARPLPATSHPPPQPFPARVEGEKKRRRLLFTATAATLLLGAILFLAWFVRS